MSKKWLVLPAQALTASCFLIYGYETMTEPGEGRIAAARKLNLPATEAMVRLNGAAMVLGGLLMASGRSIRLAEATLAVSMIPTTYCGHPYWESEDPSEREGARVHFFKNASLTGALILLALSGGQSG